MILAQKHTLGGLSIRVASARESYDITTKRGSGGWPVGFLKAKMCNRAN
jgi:hypothetical protein